MINFDQFRLATKDTPLDYDTWNGLLDEVKKLPLTIDGNNVGVDTLFPRKKLEVSGEIVCKSGVPDSKGAVSLSVDPFGTASFSTNSSYEPEAPDEGWIETINMKAGKVGIGTKTPQSELDVDGVVTLRNPKGKSNNVQIDFTGDYKFYRDDASSVAADKTRLWLQTPDHGEVILGPRFGKKLMDNLRFRSDNISFENRSSGVGVKIASGKVGIGTASPISKLDVRGDHIVMQKHANDTTGKRLLNRLPNNSLVIGGPWNNRLIFYWKDKNGTKYKAELIGQKL